MNNEDRPMTDRPTFLDVNDRNIRCIQDRFVIFGSKVWFLGTANATGSFKFTSNRPLLPWQRNLRKKSAITRLIWEISPRSKFWLLSHLVFLFHYIARKKTDAGVLVCLAVCLVIACSSYMYVYSKNLCKHNLDNRSFLWRSSKHKH